MEDIKQVYKQLTAVDIEEQYRLWDERGKGYYGEYLVLNDLYRNISGNCKILMNLQVPTAYNTLTEIDLLMIHETGIYVFEVKHYKGRIYGTCSQPKWTQYFRTTQNHTFDNPIGQNHYHIQALQQLLPNETFHSVIVFTNDDCVLKVENPSSEKIICKLDSLLRLLNEKIARRPVVHTMEEIDQLFLQLAIYSPMSNNVQINDTLSEAPLYAYFDLLKNSLDTAAARAEQAAAHAKQKEKAAKKRLQISIAVCILISILVLWGGIRNCNEKIAEAEAIAEEKIAEAEAKLNEFAQNFKHIDEIDNPYVKAINNIVTITSIELNVSDSLENTVVCSVSISIKGSDYGIMFNPDSQYLVTTTDGKTYAYDIFGETVRYNRTANQLAPSESGTLVKMQFWGITSPKDIAYIKISNISIWNTKNHNKMLHDDLFLEILSS